MEEDWNVMKTGIELEFIKYLYNEFSIKRPRLFVHIPVKSLTQSALTLFKSYSSDKPS